MTCGIYQIRNTINGKRYVGSSIDIDRRWSQHVCGLRNGAHPTHHLQNAWNKYGADAFSFEIIEECSEDLLEEREQIHIDEKSEYNSSDCVKAPMRSSYHSDIRRRHRIAMMFLWKRRSWRREHHNRHAGRWRDPDFLRRWAEGVKKRSLNPKWRKNVAEGNRKKAQDQNWLRENAEHLRKMRADPEYQRKNAEHLRKMRADPEYQRKNAEHWRRLWSDSEHRHKHADAVRQKQSKPVICVDSSRVFVGGIAIKAAGFSTACVSRCANGEQKTHKGFRWMFLKDYDATVLKAAPPVVYDTEEDGRVSAECPSVPGALAYGSSPDEARIRAQTLALEILADASLTP